MPQINRSENLFSFTPNPITASGWETITNEEWNDLIKNGWVGTQYVLPHRVSKDTICSRVLDAGKLTDLMTLIGALSAEQQFLWTNYAWFWSNNSTVTGICQQLGLETSVILAPDPYL